MNKITKKERMNYEEMFFALEKQKEKFEKMI